MTIQECYQKFGGDYDEVKKRLPSDALIKKFIVKFLDDSSFSNLFIAMKEGSRERAFAAAHTLKGVCSNFGMNKLAFSSSKLTDLLRPQTESIPEGADVLFEEVRCDHESTASIICAFLDQENH